VSGPSVDERLQDLSNPTKIKKLKDDATKSRAVIEAEQQAKDRSFIIKMIVWLFVSSVGGYLVYLLGKGWACGTDTSSAMLEVIKIAVLPVVTLAIGYYFARK
jgi:hypothetical protein